MFYSFAKYPGHNPNPLTPTSALNFFWPLKSSEAGLSLFKDMFIFPSLFLLKSNQN